MVAGGVRVAALAAALALLLPIAGCGGDPDEPSPAADSPDAGTPDAGTPDDVGGGIDPMDGVTVIVDVPDGDAADGRAPTVAQPAPAPEDTGSDLPVFDGSAGMSPDGALRPPPGDAPVTPDEPPDETLALRRLESRVATEVVDAFEYESWVCTGGTTRVEYRFSMAADGLRSGAELDGQGGSTAVRFGWAAIGADTLLLDYAELGRQVELGSILFADDDTMRANDSASGPLECRRQRYVGGAPTRDVSADAPGGDPDAEAAAALAVRIETPRIEDMFNYWYCEVADGRPVGYVFAGEGGIDATRQAVAFDIDDLDASVTDGGAGVDAGPRPPRPALDPESDDGERFRWLATDGMTLVLVPLDPDVAIGDDELATTALEGIVFLVDDAFTARRTDDGALLQCLRNGDAGDV